MRAVPVIPQPTRRQQVLVLAAVVVWVVAAAILVFGPARGARNDLASVRSDLNGTHDSVDGALITSRRTLEQLTEQLETTQDSLKIQKQGLDIAAETQRLTSTGVGVTTDIRQQTTDTLATLRQVTSALGPLSKLDGDIDVVVDGVRAGVKLARSTLTTARQTLADGREALRLAADTLATLKESRDIQLQLLDVGRRTLTQVSELNRKFPLPLSAPVPSAQ